MLDIDLLQHRRPVVGNRYVPHRVDEHLVHPPRPERCPDYLRDQLRSGQIVPLGVLPLRLSRSFLENKDRLPTNIRSQTYEIAVRYTTSCCIRSFRRDFSTSQPSDKKSSTDWLPPPHLLSRSHPTDNATNSLNNRHPICCKGADSLERPLSASILAEAYGTFVLTLLGPMSITVVNNPGLFPLGSSLGLGFIGLAFGLALLIGIATVAQVSGSQFNPAATIALAYSGRFPKKRVAPYVVAQLVGAVLAGFAQLAMVGAAAGSASDLGTTMPNFALPLPYFAALLGEIIGTFILVMTIIGSTAQSSTLHWGSSAIGLSLAAIIWAIGGVSGASLNPARTFGPSLASLVFDANVFNTYWVYLVGPILGGLLAAEIYRRMEVH